MSSSQPDRYRLTDIQSGTAQGKEASLMMKSGLALIATIATLAVGSFVEGINKFHTFELTGKTPQTSDISVLDSRIPDPFSPGGVVIANGLKVVHMFDETRQP